MFNLRRYLADVAKGAVASPLESLLFVLLLPVLLAETFFAMVMVLIG